MLRQQCLGPTCNEPSTHSKATNASIQPELHHFPHGVSHFRIFPVEVWLGWHVQMKIHR